VELKFGKFKGQTIEQVSKTNDGLAYLDWLSKNSDVNDPKYGDKNKALVAEIKRCTAGKEVYIPEKKKFGKKTPVSGAGNEEVILLLNAIQNSLVKIERQLGIKDSDPILLKESDEPF